MLATGSRVPRDLPVPGRELEGVHFALDYLAGRNRWAARELGPHAPAAPSAGEAISAAGRHVVVIGGGDTGADCVAQCHREEALTVIQIELVGEPPPSRPDAITPWPRWPMKLRTSYALEEGGERDFAITTTAFSGRERVERIHWAANTGTPPFDLVSGTEQSQPADLVLLAMGFLGPEPRLTEQLGVERDERGNVRSRDGCATTAPGVFAAGDARRGQSLIVWAIDEGRRCAAAVDSYLGALPARPAAAVA